MYKARYVEAIGSSAMHVCVWIINIKIETIHLVVKLQRTKSTFGPLTSNKMDLISLSLC